MKKGLIYKATSPSGKVYIGKTLNLFKRKSQHVRVSFDSSSREYNLAFHCAVRKYGWNNIGWEILEEGIFDKDLCNKEIYYINKHSSSDSNFGYNETLGGGGGNIFKNFSKEKQDEIRRKISKSLKGRKKPPKTDEHIRKHAEAMKGKTPWNKGIKTGPLSEETKKKMSLANKGRKKPPFTEEHRKNISLSQKGRIGYWTGKKRPNMAGDNNPMKLIENREKVSRKLKGVPKSNEAKKNMSLSKRKK